MVCAKIACPYAQQTGIRARQFPVANYASSSRESRQRKTQCRWVELEISYGSGGILASQRAFAQASRYSLASRENTVHASELEWRMVSTCAFQCKGEIYQSRHEKVSVSAVLQRHYRKCGRHRKRRHAESCFRAYHTRISGNLP